MAQSYKKQLQNIKNIYYFTISSLVLFLIVSYMAQSQNSGNTIDPEYEKMVFLIVNAIAITSLILAIFFINKRFKNLPNDTQSKLSLYMRLMIIRGALLEGSSLFLIICFFMTGDRIFTVETFVMILFMFALRPTTDNASRMLQINPREFE